MGLGVFLEQPQVHVRNFFLVFIYLFINLYNRHVLAAIHFNFNLMRDTKKNANGSEQIRVIYPKFKNGEASIRDITIEQNFGKKL